MTRKKLLYPALFFITYCLGLIIFIPSQYIEEKTKSLLGKKIEWRSFSRHLGSIELENVSLKNTSLNTPIAERVIIKPAYFRVLTGSLAAAININSAEGKVQVNAKRQEKTQWHLDFKGTTKDITPLLDNYLSNLPIGETKNLAEKNKASHENVFTFSGEMTIDAAAMVIKSGEWQADSPLIKALDLHFNDVSIHSTTVDNKMDVSMLSKGALGVKANLQVNLQPLAPGKSSLSGIINFQPDKERLDSVTALIFADPRARAIKVSGNITKPKFTF